MAGSVAVLGMLLMLGLAQGFRSFDSLSKLEPPRPDGFQFYSSFERPSSDARASATRVDPRSTGIDSDRYSSKFKLESQAKPKDGPSVGKSQYYSAVKLVPQEAKPIVVPLETSASEKAEDGIVCSKIDKPSLTAEDVYHGRFKRAAMTCFKCHDPAKGGETYEKCTTGDDPSTNAYYVTHQKSYNSKSKPKKNEFGADTQETRANPETFRFSYDNSPSKEYLAHRDFTFSGSERSHVYDIPESSYAKARGTYKDKEYTPKAAESEPSTKYSSPSAHHSSDSPSAFSFHREEEEPRQSSKPKQKKPSFHYETTEPPASFSYGSEHDEEASEPQENTKYTSKPTEYSFSTVKVQPTRSYSYETTDKPISYSYRTSTSDEPKHKQPNYERYEPKSSEYSFSKSVEDPLKTYHESSSYGDDTPQRQVSSSSYSESSPTKYHQKKPTVHEYTSSSSAQAPETYVSQPSDELKKALGEFHSKNRSNCKQVKKDKMTCWQCVDATGVQQEECMYVAGTEPSASRHAAVYTDLRETSTPKAQRRASHVHTQQVAAASPKGAEARQTRRRAPTTTTSSPAVSRRTSEQEDAFSSQFSSRRGEERGREPGNGARRRAAASEKRVKSTVAPVQEQRVKRQRPDPSTEKPIEFQVEGPEGAFSHETQERFDPTSGLSLPAYMLEKSEAEKSFDAIFKAGR